MKTARSQASVRLAHVVGTHQIHVRVSGEAQAHALLERVGALNRERLLPAIERVFDEFDRPCDVIRIDRLDLDLGRIAEGRLDEVEARLTETLRSALRRAVGTGSANFAPASEQARIVPTRLVLADAFGHYLDSGAWPYGSVLEPATRPAHLFARLLDEAPEALVPMLRARRGSDRALRRLASQMQGPLLDRLLGLLDPDSAHWILLYMAETRIAHRAEPLIDQPPEEFARTLWFVVLRDALRRSGLRSNRRAFIAKLIADLAISVGGDPGDLLRPLRRGLEAAPSAARGDASLLSILAEIGEGGAVDDRGEAGSDPAAAFGALEEVLAASASSPRTSAASAAQAARRFGLAAASAGDRESAPALLGALAAEDKAKLRRLLRDSAASDGQAAAALLAACDPEEAADLILPPHLASAVGGLIEIAGCSRPEREALLAAAAAIPPSAPAALALADLARLLASLRRIPAAGLLPRLQAEALAAGGERGRTLAALFDEAGAPASRAQRAAVRRELALETLRALLAGRLVGPPGEEGEAAQAALAGMDADSIRRDIAPTRLRPRAAAAALSRLSPRALLRLVALLAPAGGASEGVRAALAESGRNRPRLAALGAWLVVGGPAPPRPPREAAATQGSAPLAPDPTRSERDRNERQIFLLLRGGPAAAAGLAGKTGGDSASLALLFSRLPEADRREAQAIGRLLSGPGARRALGAGLVIGSLAAAVREALARRGRFSFAGLWRGALAAASSTAERAALERLLPPDGRREALSPPGQPPQPGSAAWLLELLDAPPDKARQGLRLLRSAGFRRSLVRRIPRHLLARLLFAARPHEARALLGSADLIRGAFAAEGRGIAPEALWEALLGSLLAPRGAAIARLVDRLVALDEEGAAGLVPRLLARARAARHGPLAAALEGQAAAAGQPSRKASAAAEASPDGVSDRTFLWGGEEGPILVLNAGMVIAAPFLGPLCQRAGLATAPDGALRWVEPEAAGRAVHLLQYLVDGRTDAPEPLLALNKILCGLDPSWPALPAIEMTLLERETCDSLLASILALWPALSGSSVAALRETFLQREGRLSRAGPSWKLEVERKTVDVLVDSLPWSLATILTPWTPHPLFVTW